MSTLSGLGHVHRLQGRYSHAAGCFSQARRIARDTGDRGAEPDALTGLGWLRRQQGLHTQAIDGFTQARDTACDAGNRGGELKCGNPARWNL